MPILQPECVYLATRMCLSCNLNVPTLLAGVVYLLSRRSLSSKQDLSILQTFVQHKLSTLQSTHLFQCDEEELSEVPNTTPDTQNSKYTHKIGPDTSYMFPEGAKAEVRS